MTTARAMDVADTWPELQVDQPARTRPRRRPWTIPVGLVLMLEGAGIAAFAAMDVLLVPVQALAVAAGLAAVAAGLGVLMVAPWGRLLAGAINLYWLAQSAGVLWGWLLDRTAVIGAGSSNPLLDILVPAGINGAMLVLLVRHWPSRP